MFEMKPKKRPVAMRLATLAIVLACLTALYGGTPHTQQQAAPIKLGTSGSNVKDINASFCCTGTLGSQVKDANLNKYILSNNHVLARDNAGAPGEGIMQRGYVDTVPACSTTGTVVVAHLTKFVPISFTANNTVDAAIAKVVAGKVSTTGAILQLGTVSSATVVPAVGMSVEKSGRTTGLTSAKISSINVSILVSGYGPCGSNPGKTAKFIQQFGVNSATFSGAGDSGSLIVKTAATGQKPNPVGLLFAGGNNMTFANTIHNVLTQLAVTFDATAPNAEELANAAAVADPEVEAASRVKDKYDDFLFTLPEVVGHGVGKDSSGHAVIQLFLRTATDAARQAAPIALEGFLVVIQETGEIRATPKCGSCPSCKQ